MGLHKNLLRTAWIASVGFGVTAASAATLNDGDILNMVSGIESYGAYGNYLGVNSGSYFAFDYDGNAKISASERTALAQGPFGGILIGVAQGTNGHASHSGAAHSGEGGVTAEWNFFGNAGMDYTTSPITGGTTTGLNLSGWTVTWNGIPSIAMGSASAYAWQPQNCANLGCTGWTFSTGVAQFVWDGVYFHPYTLNFAAIVPPNDPSGFGMTPYFLHLEGLVTCFDCSFVPVPAAAWLFGSGLAGVLGLGALSTRGPQYKNRAVFDPD